MDYNLIYLSNGVFNSAKCNGIEIDAIQVVETKMQFQRIPRFIPINRRPSGFYIIVRLFRRSDCVFKLQIQNSNTLVVAASACRIIQAIGDCCFIDRFRCLLDKSYRQPNHSFPGGAVREISRKGVNNSAINQ